MRSQPSYRSTRSSARSQAARETASQDCDKAYDSLNRGAAVDAAVLFREIVKREPDRVEAWHGLAIALAADSQLADAVGAFKTVLDLCPTLATAWGGLADVHLRQGDTGCAIAESRRAIDLSGDRPSACFYVTAARALCNLGRFDESKEILLEAHTLEPDNADVFSALGHLQEALDKPLDAFAAYQQALALRPRDVSCYNNIAGILIGLRQYDLAVSSARIAVSLAPGRAEPYLNLALALRLRGDEEEALSTYKAVVALHPDHGPALVELCHYRQHACEWDGLEAQHQAAALHSYRKGHLVSPFAVMTAPSSAKDQLLCARVWCETFKHVSDAPLVPYTPRLRENRQRRARIGYFSADFHHHATAMLIAGMLEQHDKSRFELYAYSIGPDDDSAIRHRLIKAFDVFVDLRCHSDAEAAELIRQDDIDILLDLKGFTQNARVKILAFHPARIQVNYLGFPGTMGVQFIDYIIADRHVIPDGQERFFQEKVVRLPRCYQPNDRLRFIPDGTLSRAACGLPEQGLIFCSFNSPYKITPELFAIWMRILRQTPNSVLWLLASNRQAAANLTREAARLDVAADRLVFAPFVGLDQHLARLALADLFLDTHPVNAHTTASEALWVGLPVLTMSGDTFAGRVAGSLVRAVGLPDLVMGSLEDYEKEAVRLSRNPALLAGLKRELVSRRATASLFDTERYTRSFEAALSEMIARCDAALPPDHIAIGDEA